MMFGGFAFACGSALAPGGGDVTAPVLQSAVVNAAGNVELTYNENIAGTPSTGDFGLFGSFVPTWITNVAVAGALVTLTPATPICTGATVSCRYRPGTVPIADAAGNGAAALVAQSCTNSSAVTATAVAPTFIGSPTYAVAASGPTRPFDYSTYVLTKGDVLVAACLSRASGTNTTTPPAGEGWTLKWSCRLAGLTLDIYWKRWGDGNTDLSRQVSTFTFQTGGNALSVGGCVLRGAKRTGDPFSQASTVPGATTAAAATITSATVASAVGAATMSLRFLATIDDNTLASPSRGTLAFSGNLTSLTGCSAMVYEAGVDSSTVTCTLSETTNGNDAYIAATLVVDGDVPDTSGIALTQLGSSGYGKSRINSTGWTGGYAIDELPRLVSGTYYYYSAAYWIDSDKTLQTRIFREPVAGGARVQVDSYSSGVIANPAGITGSWPSDSHFTATGTFSKTGRFMVALLAHGTESAMQFGKASAIGVAAVTLGDWTWQADASYPALMQMGDGTAVICYRVGIAGGDGWQTLWEENPAEDGWTQIATRLMYHSTHGESPYMNRVTVDTARDWLHVSWIWAADNISSAYHSVLYFRMQRTAPLTWVARDVAGNSLTLPVDESTANCTVDSGTTATPFCVHNGGSFDPATGLPLLTYLKASTTTHGGGTDLYAAHWSGSAWVRVNVRQVHTTWDMIDAPPNPERAVVRGPERRMYNGLDTIMYTSDIELGSSGVSCLRAVTSTDGGATWSAPFTFVDQKFYGACPRPAVSKLGKLTLLLPEQCDDDDGVFLESAIGNVALVDIAA